MTQKESQSSNHTAEDISDFFYDEILYFEKLLIDYEVEPDEPKRMVLAREIALIERLNEFKFRELVTADEKRQHIKTQILHELVNLTIPKDDDEIRIGFGGSKPRNRVRTDKRAIILLGLPASGKSTVAQVMSDMQGAYIIDSDFAKRKFPELTFPNGANWTHDESDDLVLLNGDGVFAQCLAKGANMVIPKVGAKETSIVKIYNTLKSHNYDVSLGLVWLDPKKALQRAIKRYQKSKRYVPILKIIADDDGPLKVFNNLIEKLDLEHHIQLSSDVDINQPCDIQKMTDDCNWW